MSNLNAVQTRYTDNFDRGFPGQIFNAASIDGNAVFSYPALTDVYVGRAVKAVNLTDSGQNIASGVGVGSADGVTLAAQIVGIVMTDKEALVDDNGDAYIPSGRMCTVARTNRHALIYVDSNELSVAQFDTVYVATAAVNDANIPVGAFANTAGVGLLALPWQYFKGNDLGKRPVIDLTNV